MRVLCLVCLFFMPFGFQIAGYADFSDFNHESGSAMISKSVFTDSEEGPVPVYPADGSRLGPDDPIVHLEWSEMTGAAYYQIEFSLTDIFDEIYVMDVTGNMFFFSDYLSETDWEIVSIGLYWRVRAVLPGDEATGWSEGWYFSKSRLAPPEILTPQDDTRFGTEGLMPVLSWTSVEGAAGYGIEFASDSLFESSFGWFEYPTNVYDFNGAGDPDQWRQIVGTFYWRVWCIETGDVFSKPSGTYYFSKTVIPSPVLLEPVDNARFGTVSDIPVLSWEPVDSATGYHIQLVYGDTEFDPGINYIPSGLCHMNFADYSIDQTIWNNFFGQLRWRVSSVDEFGNHGVFGADFRFVKIGAYRYMAYGDSVTGGYGSSTWGSGFAGYPPILLSSLRSRYGNQVAVLSEKDHSWFGGAHAYTGNWRAEEAMFYHAPSVVLIMFGIVDVVDPGAPGCDNFDCRVKEHLGSIIQTVRSFHATPCLATLPPINPDSDRAGLQYDVDELNIEIRDLSRETGVLLADLDHAFASAPYDLPSYYANGDWAHFNDSGYQLIADVWNSLL